MTEPTPAFPSGTILGYPRIGRRRELKRAVEAHWSGATDEATLEATAAGLRRATRERLAALGLGRTDSSIPESFSYYDQVHDAAVAVGVLPERFAEHRAADGSIGLGAYFTAARGAGENLPLEMTKWFDTNYHYLVPEIGPETAFSLSSDRLARQVAEAKADGFTVRPVLVGPVTLLALAKATNEAPEGFDPLSRLDDLLPVYAELLAGLRAAGAEWVQLDEPALVSEALPATPAALADAAARAYAVLGAATDRPAILVTAGYAQLAPEAWTALAKAPIEAIAVDLTRGALPAAVDGLDGKVLVGGVIDGRNIWRGDLAGAWAKLEALETLGAAQVSAGTSTSLQHVPHDVADETRLDPRLVSWLAFADQKTQQVVTLARGLAEGAESIATEVAAASAALADRRSAPGVRDGAVRGRIAALTAEDFHRGDDAARVAAQDAALGLPVLPTTTIGSFPQTGEIRRARARHGKAEITTDEYEEFLREEIARVVTLQEDLGLDVLVHGEAERNDMVQYFAENLDGFDVTENGWVQSYGSRATRPSILWGDVSRPAPITVSWSAFAQSLTDKPMKGMLTGPVTILAWSFVRDDQPLADTANQVALALRDEITDLEAAGIGVIQVDEPALRELLPLKKADQPAYLEWSVGSFRLSTAGAADATQVHTHLCYSEFDVVIDAIAALDADVTSIEAARSRGEVIGDIAESGFSHGVGPGVYDIHSPRVPSVAEVTELLDRAATELPLRQVWVNPDCGLKTRGYDETVESLRNIIEATRAVREKVGAAV
ncbi:5-methyltetrahydropteroyltriglutamate--homocysteine methyltransferase [Microbacterium sp. Root166]|uniref:5-methyltetrahydropteroyltriglutamate-- homocysteine S-methyltransferase n=1 Tax=Microbacterium sp. Root166 TaxID=1736478 RepID=UPI0006F88355|nr:5-methyltetrahydropteroyltriglutamate--homocysteine S-methyltransferase [Microbacterium sp. Root166]KQZ82302.1 5-methyltetrahydropteroyltriglutamate--homocysteine methyltransferase [Microbacterium sp. Root166]